MVRVLSAVLVLAAGLAVAVWWATEREARALRVEPTVAADAAGDGRGVASPIVTPPAVRAVADTRRAAPHALEPEASSSARPELVVRAVDALGAALSDVAVSPALVAHRDERQGSLAQQRTAADGSARWALAEDALHVGDALSVFLHPRGGELLAVTWSGPWPGQPIDVRLERRGELHGRVSFAETGAEVTAGRIHVQWRLSEEARGSSSCRVEGGSFRAPDVVGEIVSLGLVRAGFQYVSVEPESLTVPPGGTVRFDVAFSQGPALTLRVVDAETDEPVPDALVRTRTGPSGTTDEQGRLELRGVFAVGADSVTTAVRKAGYAPLERALSVEEARAGEELDLRLVRGSVVEGVVVDGFGVQRPGLTVLGRRTELYGIGGSRRHLFEQRTTTDEEGRFRLTGLPACEDFDLIVLDDRRPLALWRLRLPEDEGWRDWLIEPAASISGIVVDAEGAPVVQKLVSAFQASTGGAADGETDVEGRFSLDGLHSGDWTLVVSWGEPLTWGGSYTYSRRVVKSVHVDGAHEEWVRIELPPEVAFEVERLRLRVQVSDLATAAPLKAIEWLQVVGVDSDLSIGLSSPTLDEGAFEYELPPGTHTLSIRSEGYELFREDLELRAGESPPVLHARLVAED